MATMHPVGTIVRATCGNPKPPTRFKKKLASWQADNFYGIVTRHDEFIGQPALAVERIQRIGGHMRCTTILPPCCAIPVEGAPLAPVTGNGYSAEIDHDGLAALNVELPEL